ncbi:MAG: hypothetical protein RIB79_09360 [Allomuricauda sp.]|uniref:hypothetical protein n=1 Tax=Yeosuana marina TaxID=1565536 RepID=UPI0030DA41D0|tara:strand:- start:2047 stop:2727 length:681 start_codon:yes stop_codon:yes gene_type:complete
MEKLKHSEDAILKLGKKIIKELQLEHTGNTLVRWMIHYISELMENADKAPSGKKKEQLRKECCQAILELWRNREFLPMKKPLQNVAPILEILEVFKERDFLISPRWLEYRALPRDNKWASFVDLVKNNSEKIFNQCMDVNFNEEIIFKEKEWYNEHGEFLSKEEKEIISHLDMMIQLKNTSSIDTNAIEKTSKKEKFDYIFNELESLINEQKNELINLKKSISKSL